MTWIWQRMDLYECGASNMRDNDIDRARARALLYYQTVRGFNFEEIGMRKRFVIVVATLVGVGLWLGAGCDWTSSGSSLNTSKGAGININFSGVYNGNIRGRAVDRTSAGTISYFTIRQTGNRIEVVDSQGSRYEGSVGAPGLVAEPGATGAYPPGAELVQAQISWTGKDGVAQKDVEFVGIIHAVSVEDIQGESKKVETVDNHVSEDNYTSTKTVTVVTNATGEIKITEKEVSHDADGNLVYEKVTEITIPASPGDVEKIERVIVDKRARSRKTTTTSETSFKLTEANVQYRLEGTWIEKNSPIVSRVDAISRGTFGVITISTRGSQEPPRSLGGGGGGGGS